MRKRLMLATVAVSVIACIVLAALAMLPPRPGITKANFDRIQVGMTLGEVTVIFGRSPTGEADNIMTIERDPPKAWNNGKQAAAIHFREDGRVSDKNWIDFGETETFLERVRRWLHLN